MCCKIELREIYKCDENTEEIYYQGYIWWSDMATPEVFLGNKKLTIDPDELKRHFIVEGQLCDGKNSYSIKYIDGKHWVYRYDIANKGSDLIFLPHHFNKPEIKALKFIQRWRAVPDARCCEGMEVLQPAEFIFIGFLLSKNDYDNNKSTF